MEEKDTTGMSSLNSRQMIAKKIIEEIEQMKQSPLSYNQKVAQIEAQKEWMEKQKLLRMNKMKDKKE